VAVTRSLMFTVVGLAVATLFGVTLGTVPNGELAVFFMLPLIPIACATILIDGLRASVADTGQSSRSGWKRFAGGAGRYRIPAIVAITAALWALLLDDDLLSLEALLFLLAPAIYVAAAQTKSRPMNDEIHPRGDVEFARNRALRVFAIAASVLLVAVSVVGAMLVGELGLSGAENPPWLRSAGDATVKWALSTLWTWILLWLPLGIVLSMRATQISASTYPGQGIVNAARAAVFVFAVGALLTALIGHFVVGLDISRAILGGVTFGLVAGFLFSGYDVIAHWLGRVLLSVEAGTPLRRFLTWGARTGVLRQVGGRFIFRHALVAASAADLTAEGDTEQALRRRRRLLRLAAAVLVALFYVPWLVLALREL
jgi:hypothetical protein